MLPTLDITADLKLVLPELILIVAMCVAILVPFINRRNIVLPTLTALIGLGLALVTAVLTTVQVTGDGGATVFSQMLAIDPFSQFFKIILLMFTLLVVMQWILTTRDQVHALDVPDYVCLLLGATVGMALMASANNLLMIFVATEAASLPSFALAGFRKRLNIGSESALKYVIFGSAASAVSIYGMSLIYGATGSLDLAAIAQGAEAGMSPMLAVGIMAMLAGVAFKLSAVPLHFWCPDVFQGAPIEVTTFLSVASKGAAVCLLLRVLYNFGEVGAFPALAAGVGILGAVTATWGNLAALQQSNIKRLLAYSSIAHAGYMIMGCSVAAMGGMDYNRITIIAGAVLFYLMVYTFMNLGAFTVAAVIARRTGSEAIEDYVGMSTRSWWLAALLSLFMLSLFGMPPLGGFLAKMMVAAAMTEAGNFGMALIAVLLLNTLVSLYYYVRPIYFMYLRVDTQNRPSIMTGGALAAMLLVCAAGLVATGVNMGDMSDRSRQYGQLVRSTSLPVIVPEDEAARLVEVMVESDAEAR